MSAYENTSANDKAHIHTCTHTHTLGLLRTQRMGFQDIQEMTLGRCNTLQHTTTLRFKDIQKMPIGMLTARAK